MKMNDYQDKAKETGFYPKIEDDKWMLKDAELSYVALGLAGEAGEIANKVKKIFRDDGGYLEEARRLDLKYELGDVLWYVSELSRQLGYTLEEVAESNLDKLEKRHKKIDLKV